MDVNIEHTTSHWRTLTTFPSWQQSHRRRRRILRRAKAPHILDQGFPFWNQRLLINYWMVQVCRDHSCHTTNHTRTHIQHSRMQTVARLAERICAIDSGAVFLGFFHLHISRKKTFVNTGRGWHRVRAQRHCKNILSFTTALLWGCGPKCCVINSSIKKANLYFY